jgi:hypothetical protein
MTLAAIYGIGFRNPRSKEAANLKYVENSVQNLTHQQINRIIPKPESAETNSKNKSSSYSDPPLSPQITLARQLSRAENSANRAREEVLTLRQQLDEKEARLYASQGEARAVQLEQQRAIRRLESALACQARASPLFGAQVFGSFKDTVLRNSVKTPS